MAAPGTQVNLSVSKFEWLNIRTSTNSGADAVQLTLAPKRYRIAHAGFQTDDVVLASATPSVASDYLIVFDLGPDGTQTVPGINAQPTTNTTGASAQGRKLIIFPGTDAPLNAVDLFPSQGLQATKKIGLVAVGHGAYVTIQEDTVNP